MIDGGLLVEGADVVVEGGTLEVAGNFTQSDGDTEVLEMTSLSLTQGGNFTICGGAMRVGYEALVSIEGNYTASGGSASNGSGTVSVMGDFTQTGGATYADSNYQGGTVAHSFDISGGEFHVGGQATSQNDFTIEGGGTAVGDGGVISAGTVQNDGTIKFGDEFDFGSLEIAANYVQSGTLLMKINISPQWDYLLIDGLATFGGTLNVICTAGLPSTPMSFTLISANSSSGSFSVNKPPADGVWHEDYTGGYTMWVADE